MAGFIPWAAMGARPIRYDTFENTPYAPRTGMPPQQGAPLVPLQMPRIAALPPYGPTPGELTQAEVNQEALQNTVPGSGGQAAMAMAGAGRPVRQNAEDPDMKRYIDFLNQLDTKGKEVVAAQQAGVDQYGRSLEATKALPNQLDLSPLMALSDTWYGGNLSKGYTKPASTEQRTQDIMALQNALSRQKAGVSETELGLIKQRLGGEEALAGMKNAREMAALRKQEMAQAKKDKEDYKAMQRDIEDASKYEKSDYEKDMKMSTRGIDMVKQVKSIIARNGGQIPLLGNPLRAAFEAAFTNMQLDQKEQKYLGALSGPDMDLIIRATGNPTMLSQAIDSVLKTSGGGAGFIDRLNTAENNMHTAFKSANTMARTRYKQPTASDIISQREKEYAATSASTGERSNIATGSGTVSGKPKKIEQGGVTYILNEKTGQYE